MNDESTYCYLLDELQRTTVRRVNILLPFEHDWSILITILFSNRDVYTVCAIQEIYINNDINNNSNSLVKFSYLIILIIISSYGWSSSFMWMKPIIGF